VVSFAAQVGTFPLSIYYFHQFPNYFFLTNLLVIPLVWLIIYAGIFTLAASVVWSWLAAKISFLLNILLMVLNISVSFIDKLPFSKMENLVLYLPQVLILYGLIVLLMQFFLQKKGSFFVMALVFSVVLLFSFTLIQYKLSHQQKLVVYKVNNHTAIDIYKGREVYFLADSLMLHDAKAYEFNIKNNRIYSGAGEINKVNLDDTLFNLKPDPAFVVISKYFVEAMGKRIAIPDSDFNPAVPAGKLRVDYVILRNNPKAKLDKIIRIFDFKYLIMDSSNSWGLSDDWAEWMSEAGIKVHNIRTEGAFVADL
jgi:competence protein ComEC